MDCKNCGYHGEDEDMLLQCPNCKLPSLTHTPPHKIYLCEKQNPEGHGRNGGKLGNIHKKIILNQRGKQDTYHQILKLVRTEKKQWSSTEIINRFGVGGLTDGDVIRTILDMLVCQGYLKKTFMQGKKFHLYDSDLDVITPCPFLDKKQKGKNIGLYKCKFDFKNNGKELDSWKIFKEKGEENGNKS